MAKVSVSAILIVFGFLAFAVAITLIATNVIKLRKNKKSTDNRSIQGREIPKVDTGIEDLPDLLAGKKYIRPKQYELGLIKGKPYKTANLCNDNVLYPIQQLEVDYGSKIPDDCPCTQFIRSP